MMYSRSTLDTLKGLVDPRDILISIGNVAPGSISESNNEIRCPCPLHGGDRDNGFSWRRDTGVWTCFTKNCGHNVSRDLYGFVALKLNLSFLDAVKHLARVYNFTLQEGSIENYSMWAREARAVKEFNAFKSVKVQKLPELESLPGYEPSGWDKLEQYLNIRNYTLQQVQPFNLYPCQDKVGYLRLGIPIYDHEGTLISVNARRMDGVIDYLDKAPKYDRVGGIGRASILYNLNIAKKYSANRELILVEGELSCIRMHLHGFKNTVALGGSTMSPAQATLAAQHSARLLFLVEEGEAAEKGTLASVRTLYKLGIYSISITSLRSGDPDTNSKESIIQALENAQRIPLSTLKEWFEA